MSQVPDYFDAYSHIMRVILLAVLFAGLGLALARTRLPFAAKLRTWFIVVIAVLVWFGIVLWLSRQGVFQAAVGVQIPAIPFAIVIPVIAGLLLLTRSRTIAELIDATPLSWLVGIQLYRVLGGVIVAYWAIGLLPGAFALPAGVGDVLVGLLAVPVAVMAARGLVSARRTAYAWNGLGILDLVVAVATGFLTSPGRFQLLALDQPNTLTTAYPLVLIPAFAVPLSLILHGLCIWKLRRLARTPPITTSELPAAV